MARYATIPKEKRRRAVLDALMSGDDQKVVAARHGISEQYLSDLLKNARTEPEKKHAEAREEENYRRRLLGLVYQ